MRVNPKILNQLRQTLSSTDDQTAQTASLCETIAEKRILKDCDTDGDKSLSMDEVSLSQEAFDKLDADKNGKVSADELQNGISGTGSDIYTYYMAKRKSAKSKDLLSTVMGEGEDDSLAETAAKKYIANKDADKNGSLERAEVSSLSTANFDKLDTDKNGALSQAEMKTALKGHESALSAYFKNQQSASSLTDTTSLLLQV